MTATKPSMTQEIEQLNARAKGMDIEQLKEQIRQASDGLRSALIQGVALGKELNARGINLRDLGLAEWFVATLEYIIDGRVLPDIVLKFGRGTFFDSVKALGVVRQQQILDEIGDEQNYWQQEKIARRYVEMYGNPANKRPRRGKQNHDDEGDAATVEPQPPPPTPQAREGHDDIATTTAMPQPTRIILPRPDSHESNGANANGTGTNGAARNGTGKCDGGLPRFAQPAPPVTAESINVEVMSSGDIRDMIRKLVLRAENPWEVAQGVIEDMRSVQRRPARVPS